MKTIRNHKLDIYDWLILAVFWLVGLVFGYVGWSQWALQNEVALTILDRIYFTIQLITLGSGSVTGALPLTLQVARFYLPMVAAYTTIRVLLETFRERMQWLSLTRIANHIVICGLGRKALYLTRSFRELGHKVVIIEDDTQNDRIPIVRELGAIVLIGSPKDPFILEQAAIQRAESVVVVDEDDDDNVAIAAQVQKVLEEARAHKKPWQKIFRDTSLRCVVHLSDPAYINLLQIQVLNHPNQDQFTLQTFNIFRQAAQVMWQNLPAFDKNAPIDEDSHLLVVGLGHFGQSLILQAAHDWQFTRQGQAIKLKVTIIDRDAAFDFASFRHAYPGIEEVCEFHLCSIDVRSDALLNGAYVKPGWPPFKAGYLCIDNDHLNLYTALALAESFPEQPFPISVRLLADTGIAGWMHGYQNNQHSLHLVCVLDEVCTADILFNSLPETLAQKMQAHPLYREIFQREVQEIDWDQMPEELRNRYRSAALSLGRKLSVAQIHLLASSGWQSQSFSFSDAEVEALAEMEHERWMEDLTRHGWKEGYGETNGRKTHPYLRPWLILEGEKQEIFRELIRQIPGMLNEIGYTIARE